VYGDGGWGVRMAGLRLSSTNFPTKAVSRHSPFDVDRHTEVQGFGEACTRQRTFPGAPVMTPWAKLRRRRLEMAHDCATSYSSDVMHTHDNAQGRGAAVSACEELV